MSAFNILPVTWNIKQGYDPNAATWRNSSGLDPYTHVLNWVGNAQRNALSRGITLNQNQVNQLAQLATGAMGNTPGTGFNLGAYGGQAGVFANTFNPGEAVDYITRGTIPQHEGLFAPNVTTPGTGPGAPIPGVNPVTGQPITPPVTQPVTPPSSSPGGVQTPGTGQGNQIANEMLAADPEIAFRQGMVRAGYAPDRPGVLNSFIKSKFMPQFKDLFNVADITQGNNFVPDINSFISNYWNSLRGGGNTRQLAQPMLQQLLGQGNQLEGDTALTPAEEMDLTAAASRLANIGAGNTYNRVLDRQRQASENQFGDYVYNLAQTGQTQEDPFLTWLKRQSMWRRLVPQGQGY